MLTKLRNFGLIPVVTIDNVDDSLPLAQAFINGGLPVMEITFRTKAAKAAIKTVSEKFPDVFVGAGTVLSKDQVDDARSAGASFIVSPGFNPKVVEYCMNLNMPIYPGVNSPTGIEQAIEMGLNVVKFFPAESCGGVSMLKAVAAPYVNMNFIPTGGINEKNISSYLSFNKVIACGGSWLAPKDLIHKKDYKSIELIIRQAVKKVIGLEFVNIGLASGCTDSACRTEELFSSVFGIDVNSNNEFIKLVNKSQGDGYITFKVSDMDRALAYFNLKGIKSDFSGDSKSTEPVYLDCELSGLTVLLVSA